MLGFSTMEVVNGRQLDTVFLKSKFKIPFFQNNSKIKILWLLIRNIKS